MMRQSKPTITCDACGYTEEDRAFLFTQDDPRSKRWWDTHERDVYGATVAAVDLCSVACAAKWFADQAEHRTQSREVVSHPGAGA